MANVTRVTVVKEPTRTIQAQPHDKQVDVLTGRVGPTGPQGPAGADFYYLHTQASDSTTWTISHNLGREPNVTAIVGGARVRARADYPDLNTVVLAFNTATSGRAVLS